MYRQVQEMPKALSSLKYFNENAPQYQIVCAGSLLGGALHQGTSFPVGKVEFLDLYPLSYFEFLMAMGKEQHVEQHPGAADEGEQKIHLRPGQRRSQSKRIQIGDVVVD